MKPLEYPLMADENIHPHVVSELRLCGQDVVTVAEVGAAGSADRVILAAAHAAGRVVVTHDRDFGTLAVREGAAFTGIIFLRPGHVDPRVVLGMVDALAAVDVDVEPPFIVVAELRGQRVHVRFRPSLLPRDPDAA